MHLVHPEIPFTAEEEKAMDLMAKFFAENIWEKHLEETRAKKLNKVKFRIKKEQLAKQREEQLRNQLIENKKATGHQAQSPSTINKQYGCKTTKKS